MSGSDSDGDLDLDVEYKTTRKTPQQQLKTREETSRNSGPDGVADEEQEEEEVGGEEEEEKIVDYELKSKRFNDEQRRENMRILLGHFSGDQLHRYECYRRSGFQRSTVKKIMQTILGTSVSPTSVIVLAGVAKIFVGEIVEKARDVQDEWGEEGPLKPKHLREAHRRLKRAKVIPNTIKGPKRVLM